MGMTVLKEYIKLVLEEKDVVKSAYGNNFGYALEEYTQEPNGLAEYGVHFSMYPKWGINPRGEYFPKGVYFYFLSKNCSAGKGSGFATNSKFANVAKINNDKMVILKQGHPQNFSEEDLEASLSALRLKFGSEIDESFIRSDGSSSLLESNQAFMTLFLTISNLDESLGSFNRILFEAGYYGIVDYDMEFLPIEGCQGVQTWPGGCTLVQSIKRNSSIAPLDDDNRMDKIVKYLMHQKNGSMDLSREELIRIVKNAPKYWHKWDHIESQMDIIGFLLKKVNLENPEAWEWATNMDKLWFFYADLERNPTTPREFWEDLAKASDYGARETAKDMLDWLDSEK